MHLVALMMGSDHSRFVEATLIRAGQSVGGGVVVCVCGLGWVVVVCVCV